MLRKSLFVSVCLVGIAGGACGSVCFEPHCLVCAVQAAFLCFLCCMNIVYNKCLFCGKNWVLSVGFYDAGMECVKALFSGGFFKFLSDVFSLSFERRFFAVMCSVMKKEKGLCAA